MNLSSTLEKSWAKITSSQSKGGLANVSLLAFQLCESIRVEHPELDICFDGRDLQDASARPDIIIQSKGKKSEILFLVNHFHHFTVFTKLAAPHLHVLKILACFALPSRIDSEPCWGSGPIIGALMPAKP